MSFNNICRINASFFFSLVFVKLLLMYLKIHVFAVKRRLQFSHFVAVMDLDAVYLRNYRGYLIPTLIY